VLSKNLSFYISRINSELCVKRIKTNAQTFAHCQSHLLALPFHLFRTSFPTPFKGAGIATGRFHSDAAEACPADDRATDVRRCSSLRHWFALLCLDCFNRCIFSLLPLSFKIKRISKKDLYFYNFLFFRSTFKLEVVSKNKVFLVNYSHIIKLKYQLF